MNSFNDLMNDEISIQENSGDSKGFGDTSAGETISYDARVVEVFITVRNKAGVLVYPEYKIFLTKDIPLSISDSATIIYNTKNYEIEKKSAIKNEKGIIVGWVIFI